MRNFYKLVVNGYEKEAGVIHPVGEWPLSMVRDGVEVKDWKVPVAQLRDGKYCHFDFAPDGSYMVSEELKALMESFIGDDPNVEFLPVKVLSEEYGDRTYYIVHFKEVYRHMINKRHSDENNGTYIRYALDYEKVKGLKMFTARGNDILVCPALATAIKKQKLKFGTVICPIRCFKEGE